MKLFLKLFLALLVLAVALPFYLKDDGGRPLITLDRLQAPKVKLPQLPDLSAPMVLLDKARRSLTDLSAEPAKPTTVYKWRDERGTVHYSDKPNPQGGSEQIVANPQTNLVPARKSSPATTAAAPADSGPGGLTLSLPTSIPIGQVPQLIDDARQLQQFSQLRESQRKELTGL